MYYPRFYFDPTYILVLIGVAICGLASLLVKSTFARYSRVRNYAGISGAEAARRILQGAGIYDVRIEHVSGHLTDHYDPRNKVLRLSDATYSDCSVAAVGVAAHECGHAIQHANNYIPVQVRGALVPIVHFGATIAWPLIVFGLFLNGRTSGLLIHIGILAFSLSVVFQLVTLPVEFNASRRAVRILADTGMMQGAEISGTKKVLTAAALTYVAGTISAILQLVRILILVGGRRNDEDDR